MTELLNEIFEEASKGKIEIAEDEYPIAFNTILNDKTFIGDDYYPTLIIKDIETFNKKLLEYITLFNNKEIPIPNYIKNNKNDQYKLITSYLFANASVDDFSNPIALLDRKIAYLKDDTFENTMIETNPLQCFNGSSIQVEVDKQSIFNETPNKMDISLVKDGMSYSLPSVSFGIKEEHGAKVCYVYALQNLKDKKLNESEEKYNKKINRELYKLNSGISEIESDEYKQYKSGESDFYPSNITDVSPSAILSLSVFKSILKKENITNLKIVPYLPVRYIAREISSGVVDTITREELRERNDLIQSNATDKFIRTFKRLEHHYSDFEISSLPYEVDSYMSAKIGNLEIINNPILQDITDKLNESLERRKVR